MNWPDPECCGPHKIGQRMIPWQHTAECKESRRKLKNGSRVTLRGATPDYIVFDELANEGILDRARKAGAV